MADDLASPMAASSSQASPRTPPVGVVTPLQAAWLSKRSVSGVLKNWRRRWIELRPSSIAWHEQPGSPALGSLAVNQLTRLHRTADEPLTITLTRQAFGRVPSRELALRFSSDAELEAWWESLVQLCEEPVATLQTPERGPLAAASPRSVTLVAPEASSSGEGGPPLQVRVAFKATETRGALSFATYEVTCTEGTAQWRHVVRWSDLRRMHDELHRWHAHELNEARRTHAIPALSAHGGLAGALRLGAARLAPGFCRGRAQEMEQLLGALAGALRVSLARHEGPAVLRNFLAKGCDVEQPTPEERWYTAEHGWPAAVVAWAGEERLAPCSISPTGAAAAALPGEVLGELRVELLQATGLISADVFSYNDVYALLLYDGACARTCVLEDAQHPRWQPEDGRAARFDIVHPAAALYVGLFDADFSFVDDDEALGRAAVEVRRLQPGTQYTAWYPLQMKNLRRATGRYGRVQLRYSVTWRAPRLRLLKQLAPPPAVEMPLQPTGQHTAQQARGLVLFTRHGVNPDSHYKWAILDEHLKELLAVLDLVPACVDAVERVVFWRRPLSSAVAFVLWQLVCSDGALALSCVPLLLLAVLAHTYRASRAGPAIHRPPAVWALLSALTLGWLPPLECAADAGAGDAACAAAAGGGAADAALPALPPAPAQDIADVAVAALAAKRCGAAAGVSNVSQGGCPRGAAAVAPSPLLVRRVRQEQAASPRAGGGGAPPPSGAAEPPGASAAHASALAPGGAAAPAQASGGRTSGEGAGAPAREEVEEVEAEEEEEGLGEGSLAPTPTPTPRKPKADDSSSSDDEAAAAARAVPRRRRPLEEELRERREAETARIAAMAEVLRKKARARKRNKGLVGMYRAGARALINIEVSELTINPVAPVLGPIQKLLGEQLLPPLRAAHALLSWEDPAVTAWLCLALLLLATAIPLLPWEVLLRALGAAALGPHMFWVGKVYFRHKDAAVALENRYQAASNAGARAILREQLERIRQQEQAEAAQRRAEAEKEEAKRPEAWRAREAARRELLDQAAETVVVTPSFLVDDKFPMRCDAATSSATALRAPAGARRRRGARRHASSVMGFHAPSPGTSDGGGGGGGAGRTRLGSGSSVGSGVSSEQAPRRRAGGWSWETGIVDMV